VDVTKSRFGGPIHTQVAVFDASRGRGDWPGHRAVCACRRSDAPITQCPLDLAVNQNVNLSFRWSIDHSRASMPFRFVRIRSHDAAIAINDPVA